MNMMRDRTRLLCLPDGLVMQKNTTQLEPNAMTLATIDSMGKPHARIVLLKGQDGRDFKFYTNYWSHKGE